MKLNNRLKRIKSMIPYSHYTHIWDCCCDHGLLGAALLSQATAPNIHFVDIVPEIMSLLKSKLQRFYQNSLSNWESHCLDVSELPITQYKGKNLVIIAGMGGDSITQLVNSINSNHPATNIDFLLCPVHHQFTLRQQLIQLEFKLINETLVEENNRFYEIMLVSSHVNVDIEQTTISPVGELIWQTDSAEQLKTAINYLNKTLNHHQRMQQGKNVDNQHIIDAYRSVTI